MDSLIPRLLNALSSCRINPWTRRKRNPNIRTLTPLSARVDSRARRVNNRRPASAQKTRAQRHSALGVPCARETASRNLRNTAIVRGQHALPRWSINPLISPRKGRMCVWFCVTCVYVCALKTSGEGDKSAARDKARARARRLLGAAVIAASRARAPRGAFPRSWHSAGFLFGAASRAFGCGLTVGFSCARGSLCGL